MSFGTFNNSAYSPPPPPPVDPNLNGDPRREYDQRALYLADTRRSPSPGPSRPYPAYDRYIPSRTGNSYRAEFSNSYRPDSWRPERSYRSRTPSADHYEPAYSDEWGRQSGWASAYSPAQMAARLPSPPPAWPRGRRDSNVMAARMFEPSDAWKQTQGPESEQESPHHRYLESRGREPRPAFIERGRREDYTQFPVAGDSYRPQTPAYNQRNSYRGRQSDSYRPTYDNTDQWDSPGVNSNAGSYRRRTPTLLPRPLRARPNRPQSRYDSYDRSFSGSPSSSRSSSRAPQRRLGGRSISPTSSRERSRKLSRGRDRSRSRSSSRSSIASSVNDVPTRSPVRALPAADNRAGGPKSVLSVRTNDLRPSSPDRSSLSPTSKSDVYGPPRPPRGDNARPHPSLPARPQARSAFTPNSMLRPRQDTDIPGLGLNRPTDGFMTRDMGAPDMRKKKKRRGGVARRARLNNYSPYSPRSPPLRSQTLSDPLRPEDTEAFPSVEPLEPKLETPDLDLKVTQVQAPDIPAPVLDTPAVDVDLVVETADPALDSTDTEDLQMSVVMNIVPDSVGPLSPTTVSADLVEPFPVVDAAPKSATATPSPLAAPSDLPPPSILLNVSDVLPAAEVPAASEEPLEPPSTSDLLPALPPAPEISHPLSVSEHPNLPQPVSASSPVSSTARSPSLPTPSPPQSTPSVLVVVANSDEQEHLSSLPHLNPKRSTAPSNEQTPSRYFPIRTKEADSLQEALKVVVSARKQFDVQLREDRVDPVILSNLALVDSPPSIPPSAEALVNEMLEGPRSRARIGAFTELRPALVEHLAARHETVEEKIARLRREYLDLHHKWVARCASLDNSNQSSSVEEVAAVSGRTTRRSAAVLGDAVRSDLEMEQIIASLGNEELYDPAHLAVRNVAVIPDMICVTRGKVDYLFDDTSNLIDDPATFYDSGPGMAAWTDAEAEVFKEKFAAHPKQFGIIAQSLPHKTQAQCVQFYYLHKKTQINFREVIAGYGQGKKRRGGRRTDKKKGGLLADIRQHDAEVSKAGPSTRRQSGTGGRRKRTAATAEPSRRTSRRSTVQATQVEPSPMTTPTPDPEPEVRSKRRRPANTSKQASAAEQEDPDATDVEPPPKRTRRGRRPKPVLAEPSATEPGTPSEMEVIPLDPKAADQSDSTMRRRSSTTMPVTWSDEDQAVFLKLLAQHGDDFKRIAASMPNKTTIQVSAFYKANLEELNLEGVAAQAPKCSPTPEMPRDPWIEAAQYPASGTVDGPSERDRFLVASTSTSSMAMDTTPDSDAPNMTPVPRRKATSLADLLGTKPSVSGWPGTPFGAEAHDLPPDSRTIYSARDAPHMSGAGCRITSPYDYYPRHTPHPPDTFAQTDFRPPAALLHPLPPRRPPSPTIAALRAAALRASTHFPI